MTDMPTFDLDKWMEERSRKDDLLYNKYGKPFEAEHKGEFVAIGDDGGVILGKDDAKLLEKAIARFGSGNFALRRIGFDTEGRWL
ncbi:MAG: hypothetical protein HYY01_00130 [Chloroflexi bacterium]|nr:hypothetical protein [Chloroflexota bacterium]